MIGSRTILVMTIMAMLEGAAASLHYWQGIISVDAFALVSTIIGTITPALGVYMRTITTTALGDRKLSRKDE
jgi:hypothetical protein